MRTRLALVRLQIRIQHSALRNKANSLCPAIEKHVHSREVRDERALLREELFINRMSELLHDNLDARATERFRIEVRAARPPRIVPGRAHGLADVQDQLRLLPRDAERRR